jgi:OFA family oxalate/formate antiporter-like MFS transporter
LLFFFLYFVFPLAMIFAGNLLPKIGTRRSAMAGGLFFGGGCLLAGLGDKSFLFTVLGIGCLSGVGVGIAYIVPITVIAGIDAIAGFDRCSI